MFYFSLLCSHLHQHLLTAAPTILKTLAPLLVISVLQSHNLQPLVQPLVNLQTGYFSEMQLRRALRKTFECKLLSCKQNHIFQV